MAETKTIDLWLDVTSDTDNIEWVVSETEGTTDKTLATFVPENYDEALSFAKLHCLKTDYPVVKIDKHGNRETIFIRS